jgi:DNA-directed RNA polymerase subunit N (RpoN/RPB10)
MKIIVNDKEINAEEKDEIEVYQYFCDRCLISHTEIEVYRNGVTVYQFRQDHVVK